METARTVPPPHNDPLFLAIVPDEVLKQVITEGRTGTPMTAFEMEMGGPLTKTQIDILAKGIKKRWASADEVKKQPPPYLLSSAKAGDKKAGLKVFARDCAMCHGERGQGGDVAGAINDTAFLCSSAIRYCDATSSLAGPILACPTTSREGMPT